MEDFLKDFDWFFYRNIANSRFIAGRTGALQSYGSSNLFIICGLVLVFYRLFHLISEYNSIWHIAKELQLNPKAIHLAGMAEYAREILSLHFGHFSQILRLKRRVKPVPIPRIHMPLTLDANSLRVVSETSGDGDEITDCAISFSFDCSKTSFVSAHWGVPLDIVHSAIIPKSVKREGFGLSLIPDTLYAKAKRLLRRLLIPFYTEQCELLFEQSADVADAVKVSGDISLLCSEENFCSSEPICFNSGSRISCTIRPTVEVGCAHAQAVELDGRSVPIWNAITGHDEPPQRRVPLVIVLYTPRTQQTRVFSEGDVESHQVGRAHAQGYAEITLVKFRRSTDLLHPFSGISRVSPRVLKQVVFCGDYLSPQEPHDMFGMGDVRDKECLICIANEMDTVLLPCGHGSFCSRCLAGLRNDKCPVCRRSFYSYVKFPLKRQLGAGFG